MNVSTREDGHGFMKLAIHRADCRLSEVKATGTYYALCKGMAGFKWLRRKEETKESVGFQYFDN